MSGHINHPPHYTHSCHLKWRATISSSWKVEADGAVRRNYLSDGRPTARRAP